MKRNIAKKVLLFLLMSFSLGGHGQTTTRMDTVIHRWARQGILKHATIGVYLEDAATGEMLGSFNPHLSLAPASTLKLVTTATALEVLGPDYRFSTRLALSGTVRNDTLAGDLVIVGGGDPALGSKYFAEHYLKDYFLKTWVDSLYACNIRYIRGNIIPDASIYDDQTIPPTWIWEDMGNYYGAGVSGLSFCDNLCEIHLWSSPAAGRPTRILSVNPVIPGVTFDNRVVSSDDQRDQAYVFGSPFDSQRVIRGTIPKGKKDFVIRASVPNPAQLLAGEFRNLARTRGIKIGGQISGDKTRSYKSMVTLATTFSPPLKDLISVTNHESVNLFAEHLLKHLAYVETGAGTTPEGIRVVTDFWKNKGIDTEGLFLCDGSGLSRLNALTGKQMVQVLAYMKKSRNGDVFFHSIPAVPDGTLYSFNPQHFPEKCLRAKSGSMTRIRCYAGLLRTASGREVLFDIALNNFACSQNEAIDAIEKLLVSMCRL